MNKLLLVLWKRSDEWTFFVSDQHKFLFPKMSASILSLANRDSSYLDGWCNSSLTMILHGKISGSAHGKKLYHFHLVNESF